MADYSSQSATTGTSLVLAKIGAMLVLGVGSLVLGVLPLMVGRCRFRNRDKCRAISSGNSSAASTKTSSSIDSSNQGLLTSLLLCFGGGVLLFTTFLHLAPEVRQSVERHQTNGQLMTLGTLSMPELLFCIGFFLVYLVEETVDATLTSKSAPNEDLLYRTVSVRRCNKQSSTSVSTTTISTVTTPTSSSTDQKSSSYWQVGRFKYGDDEADEKIVNVRSGDENSAPHPVESVKEIPGHFVRPNNSAESTENLESSDNKYQRTNRGFQDDEISQKFAKPSAAAIENQNTKASGADTSVRGLLTVVALSFHAIFEGLAVGLEPSMSSVVYLAAAIATHKLVIAFCVGMELYVAGASSRTIVGYLSVFSMVTPLGIGIGLALGHFNNDGGNLGPTPTILQGMATGTLLYVVFFEVLAREKTNDKSGLLQLAAIVVGFMLMLGLQMATAHSHSHSHGHSHGSDDGHGEKSHHHDDHDHDHADHAKIHPTINSAIERIADSVTEAVSSVIASSTTSQPKNSSVVPPSSST